jgi:hypothetical protein
MLRSLPALAVALLLAGCTAAPATPASPASGTGSAGSSSPAGPADSPSPEPSMSATVIAISLKDGKVTPSGDRVALPKGTVLRLRITSDRQDELHVHGYDIGIAVKPGGTVTRDITLDKVGRFEIESHEPPLTVIQLVVS